MKSEKMTEVEREELEFNLANLDPEELHAIYGDHIPELPDEPDPKPLEDLERFHQVDDDTFYDTLSGDIVDVNGKVLPTDSRSYRTHEGTFDLYSGGYTSFR